ncbi:hypothetical protein X777_03487, partial [Ooceraea biroi]
GRSSWPELDGPKTTNTLRRVARRRRGPGTMLDTAVIYTRTVYTRVVYTPADYTPADCTEVDQTEVDTRLVVARRWTMKHNTGQRGATSLWGWRCMSSSVFNQLSVITRRRLEGHYEILRTLLEIFFVEESPAEQTQSLPARRSCFPCRYLRATSNRSSSDLRERLPSTLALSSQSDMVPTTSSVDISVLAETRYST